MRVEKLPPVRTSLKPSNHPYLNGAWTPLHEEVDAFDLDVIEGKIPTDIDGVYLRNTENQIHQPHGRFHPFDGDVIDMRRIGIENERMMLDTGGVRYRQVQVIDQRGSCIGRGRVVRPADHILFSFFRPRFTFSRMSGAFAFQTKGWGLVLCTAKYSSMALLFELHTQAKDTFVYTCNKCRTNTETYYHCETCDVSTCDM